MSFADTNNYYEARAFRVSPTPDPIPTRPARQHHGIGQANTHGIGHANTHGIGHANTHGIGHANTHGDGHRDPHHDIQPDHHHGPDQHAIDHGHAGPAATDDVQLGEHAGDLRDRRLDLRRVTAVYGRDIVVVSITGISAGGCAGGWLSTSTREHPARVRSS